MPDLFTDYLAEKPEVMAAFAGPPRALFTAAPKSAHWDPALAEAIAEYQTTLGGRPLFMGDEAVIVTGQQPGIFTGPLYTIYKAATAVLLAKKVHERFGTRCIPVFWVAGDDHDFDEVRWAHILTKTHDLLELTYEPEADVQGASMYRVAVEPSLHALIDKAAQQANGSEYRDEVAQFLHESADASGNLADWMARLMVRLFQKTPLVVFSPHLAAARAAAQPVLEQEIADPLVSTMLLNDAGERLRENGYHQQVTKGPDECNFFVEVNGRRRKVVFKDEKYFLPDEETSYSIEEMLAMVQAAPERFTANVALRCVVQQQLFPAVACVVGPGELAYWAQLKSLFRHFKKDMPIVYPRARCVLTNTKLKQLMEKFQFDLDALEGPQDELLARALQIAPPSPAQEVVRSHRPEIDAVLESLANDLEPLNKPVAQAANALRENAVSELDRMEQIIAKGDAAQAEAARKQVERLCNSFYPMRKPQERVLNVLSFLFEYGWELVPRIMKEISLNGYAMEEIEL
jgi:bacillithiol biosynthesis cysteine-adding enzyme BshC